MRTLAATSARSVVRGHFAIEKDAYVTDLDIEADGMDSLGLGND